MRTPVIAMLLVASLAGCAGAPEPIADCMEHCGPTVEPDDVQDDKGVIRGVIIDEAITPIEGATATLVGHDQAVVTGADGTFLFLDLEPGSYFVEVTKPGYAKVQTSTQVEAGVAKPDVLRVMVQRIPGSEPFSVFSAFDGYIGCAFVMWIVFPNMCSSLGDPDRNEVIDFGTDVMPEVLQAEIVWTQTQETGRDLGIIAYVAAPDGGESQRVGNVWGPSPLVCTVTREAVCDNGDGTGGGGAGLNETGFPGGFRATVFPGCYQGCIPGTAVGPGVVLQQKYSLYASGFFNHAPPEGWTLQADGEYHPDA